MTSPPLLQVRGLGVDFSTSQGNVHAVADVAFDVRAGECLAVVGESGSGKTQVLMACLGLLASNGTARGSGQFDGRELIGADGFEQAFRIALDDILADIRHDLEEFGVRYDEWMRRELVID